MRLLVTMFDQADCAALHAMYIKFAQDVGKEGAYEFYRKLWRDGMGTHEPLMQDWWSQISGLSAPEREALLELWGQGPADARAQVRAYLTSSATWEDCYKMVKELGAYALKAQQGQGEMAWGSVIDEVDWSNVLGKLHVPDMSSLETPADMQRVVDFWISGLTGYLTARELYLETAIRYHTMCALEAQSKIADESDISSAFGRALGANDQRYALSDSVAFYKRLVADDEERLAAFKSKQDPSRVQIERWLQNDFLVIQDKINDAKATHDELEKAPTTEARRANIKTLQTQMSTIGERISALKEPVGSFIASGRSLLGSVERMEAEIERIEAYLSRSSFDKVFDGAVAFASEFVSELAELAADAAKALINALLDQANIPPEDFWKLINRMGGVVEALADDPGKFADTLIGGAKEGLDSFFGNFGARLQKGIFGWLFKNAGISVDDIPKEFDVIGILKFGLQVMDLTWDSIKQMVAKKLGGGAQLEMVEQATAQIEEYMALGISGLVDLIKEQLSPATIGQMILDSVVDVLVENVVQKALTTVATLILPGAGALKAVKMLYDGLVLIIRNAAQLVELVNTLFGSLEKVIAGDTKGVAAAVDGILTQLLPSAIGFAASLLGLGDLPEQVKGAIKKMKESIEKQLEKVVDWIVGKAKGLAKSGEGKQLEKTGAITPEEKQKHVRFANEAMDALAKVEKDEGGDYATLREAKLKQANVLEKQYAPKLRKGVQMTITIPEAEEDKRDGDLDVTVKIWPNTTEKNARIKAVTQAADGTTEGSVEIPQTEERQVADLKLGQPRPDIINKILKVTVQLPYREEGGTLQVREHQIDQSLSRHHYRYIDESSQIEDQNSLFYMSVDDDQLKEDGADIGRSVQKRLIENLTATEQTKGQVLTTSAEGNYCTNNRRYQVDHYETKSTIKLFPNHFFVTEGDKVWDKVTREQYFIARKFKAMQLAFDKFAKAIVDLSLDDPQSVSREFRDSLPGTDANIFEQLEAVAGVDGCAVKAAFEFSQKNADEKKAFKFKAVF
jgi:hypothetical protein